MEAREARARAAASRALPAASPIQALPVFADLSLPSIDTMTPPSKPVGGLRAKARPGAVRARASSRPPGIACHHFEGHAAPLRCRGEGKDAAQVLAHGNDTSKDSDAKAIRDRDAGLPCPGEGLEGAFGEDLAPGHKAVPSSRPTRSR